MTIGTDQASRPGPIEPQVRRTLNETKAIARGVRAGVKAGAAKYRETRRAK